MNCPICELPIENNESKVWFCPHCFSILDEQFKTNCFPKTDGYGDDIVAYIPTAEKQRTFARTDKVLLTSYEARTQKPPKALIVKLWGAPLVAIAIATALWLLVNPVAAILSFVFMIIAITVWMTVEINHTSDPKIVEVVCGPILHYGNKHTLGFVKANVENYCSKTSPRYNYVELQKEDIISIDYDSDKLMHVLHVKTSANIKNNIVYIPDIFADKLTKRVFFQD